ncbi:MAG: hypothetical protein UU58_C0003G0049 [Candidatus Nomurabacteria bacterium GW2011_GWA2_41_25]|uniref:Coenzyme F420:L-glutamate ligase-like domain-containing protein n=2 Tax=Candidatus Nomuraibacteriota TaxID=1752729 RepID=A0A1F6YA04_9BACT|nr:MAG: hypothetical protein UU58_C0003G0049 [Candidatus Nomurabacteria bacterium GW2011_GWA2_41_25]OGI67173.1 MAG: hypothetical protein A2823_01965 [Candidatus Nomurabacteria bacterium RIFCSPHIGHO2_01_FULL_41_91]OGI80302.1 MAG: hypothetical protein A3D43_01350 [Candidatus Nomurabacteria bacterium RIFCSPHIGHO2_02_FULL_41_52]OGI84964.1 MAG: hypothetical protein A3F49_00425 [Candidatus Nomurabacteria bacterium RIFCSPHIGHO2_12_FULL_42_19]OGI94200.1 MAG: hypothetical protein A3A07_00385 [Candidatus
MEIKAFRTSIFRENEDLTAFIFKYVKNPKENSVLVITSKIIALAEGRTVEYKNQSQKNKLIKEESDFTLKAKHNLFTIKDGMIMAFAGIDESNAKGKLILLPKDSFQSAEILRKKIMHKFHLKNLGVLITDSEFVPLRVGALGVALGYAGFVGTRNYIGEKDIFGRTLKMSKTNVADSLATSAVLCMGEGKERQPLALITGAPVIFTNKTKRNELVINLKEDIYAPLFANLKTIKRKNGQKK